MGAERLPSLRTAVGFLKNNMPAQAPPWAYASASTALSLCQRKHRPEPMPH